MRALLLVLLAVVLLPPPAGAQQPAAAPAALDFNFFRTRIQPIFLKKREGLARCYVCHSQGTPLVLQPLTPGRDAWDEEQSRKNFEAIRRVVVPGNPQSSMLLMMPLANEAGSKLFHPGGKHWTSQQDPEFRLIADWIRGAK
jgi:hypothetical protein